MPIAVRIWVMSSLLAISRKSEMAAARTAGKQAGNAGAVISQIEKAGFHIRAVKMLHLTEAQARLAEQVRQWQTARQQREPTAQELAALTTQREKVEDRRLALERRHVVHARHAAGHELG